MSTKQIACTAILGITGALSIVAGAIKISEHMAHVEECNNYQKQFIAHMYDSNALIEEGIRLDDKSERLRSISNGGMYTIMQLSDLTLKMEDWKQRVEVHGAELEAMVANFENTCGPESLEEARAEVRKLNIL